MTTTRRAFMAAGAATSAGVLAGAGLMRAAETANLTGAAHGAATVNILAFGARPLRGAMDWKRVAHEEMPDSLEAFRTAIASLPVYNEKTHSGGGVVYVPHGTFMVSDTVVLPPGVVLRGQSFWGVRSAICFPYGAVQDRANPKPLVELRHPDGIRYSVPFAGLDNMSIEAWNRGIMYPLQERAKAGDKEITARVHNPGAIGVLWRGGPGSFLRNVVFYGGQYIPVSPELFGKHAILVPPECHAGPSVWDGIFLEAWWQEAHLTHARNIVMQSPTWGCHATWGEPWLTLQHCSGIVLHMAGAETPFHLEAEDSQAVVYGGWNGWDPDAMGGNYTHRRADGKRLPIFNLVNSDVAVHSFEFQNCAVAIREQAGGKIHDFAGPGGSHGGNKDKRDFLSFYPGRKGVVPTGGKAMDLG